MFKISTGNLIFFVSLGCPRNLVDTEVMIGLLLKAGYEVAASLEEADYIVINTCGFLEAARDESLETIGNVYQGKKAGAKVVVTGCMVQTHKDSIKAAHPGVDYLLGSGDVKQILEAIRADSPGENVSDARSFLEVGEVPRVVSTPQHYAYLKIAEGCRKRCAYCIIPKIKGPLKSKSIDQIVKEFRILRKGGAKEIILIAQDLGDWGKDQGFKKVDGLLEVLKTLLKEEGDFWLRLLYLYPDEVSDELIDLIASNPRICRYVDMPIQHIDNDVLKKMHRSTSAEDIKRTIKTLREKIPQMSIRTSLIVGFPGETEEQFESLVKFVKQIKVDHLGVFPYSKEPGSHAALLPDQIEGEVKLQRQARLMKIQQRIVEEKGRALIGTTMKVLVEGYHPDSELLMRGRHEGQCPDIDGMVIINEGGHLVKAFGEWYDAEIVDVIGYDLLAKLK